MASEFELLLPLVGRDIAGLIDRMLRLSYFVDHSDEYRRPVNHIRALADAHNYNQEHHPGHTGNPGHYPFPLFAVIIGPQKSLPRGSQRVIGMSEAGRVLREEAYASDHPLLYSRHQRMEPFHIPSMIRYKAPIKWQHDNLS